MRQFFIVLFCLFYSMVSFAHNPLSARYHLEVGDKASILTINLSQDGVSQVLINTYGKDYLENLDNKDFKELIVGYIKDNFNVYVDSIKIELGDGGIRLGSHQTDLKFVLKPIPRETNILIIDIPAFKKNDEHQSIFSYSIYGKSDKVILSKRNNYMAEVYLTVQKAGTSWAFGIGLLLVGFAFLLFCSFRLLKTKRIQFSKESIS